jgi:hypothetical protein
MDERDSENLQRIADALDPPPTGSGPVIVPFFPVFVTAVILGLIVYVPVSIIFGQYIGNVCGDIVFGIVMAFWVWIRFFSK